MVHFCNYQLLGRTAADLSKHFVNLTILGAHISRGYQNEYFCVKQHLTAKFEFMILPYDP